LLLAAPLISSILLSALTPEAAAANVILSPSVSVVGSEAVGVRGGARLAFEFAPPVALELIGDYSPLGFDAGLSMAGRAWIVGDGVTGFFLLGRATAGMASHELPADDDWSLGSWTGIYGGFGGRPVPWLHIEAAAGPEWVGGVGARWRTELTVGVVFGPDSTGGGGGSVRHHPRKP
jgi:hypothetical protein